MPHNHSDIAAFLKPRFASWSKYRLAWEREWNLAYIRANNIFQKEHQNSCDGDDWHSGVSYPVVRKKIRVALAIIDKTLFGNGRFPFDLASTPDPDEIGQTIIQKYGIDPEEIISRMRNKIEDKLVESKSAAQIRASIKSGCICGTGVIFGPFTKMIGSNKYIENIPKNGIPEVMPALEELDEAAVSQMSEEEKEAYSQEALESLQTAYKVTMENVTFDLEKTEKPVPHIRACDIWDIVMDPDGINAQSGRGVFEVRRMYKADIAKLIDEVDSEGKKMYEKDGIQRVMNSKASTMISELNRGPHRNYNIDDEATDGQESQSVDMIIYAGEVPAATMGKKGDKPVEVIVTMVGDEVLMVRENDSRRGERLYKSFVWTECEGSPYGHGIPFDLEDAARSMNTTLRTTQDNARLLGTPITTIDYRYLVDKKFTMQPGYVLRTKDGKKANEVIDVAVYPNMVREGLEFMKFIDDWANSASGIPDLLEGDYLGSKANTKYEAEQLKESAMNQLGLVLQNVDDMIVALIEGLYDWCMAQKDYVKNEIKGEFQVVATGFRSFEQKNIQRAALINLLGLAGGNPVAARVIKVDNIIRALSSLDGLKENNYVMSKDEVEELQKQEQEAQAQANAQMQAQQDHIMGMQKAELQLKGKAIEQKPILEAAKMEHESEEKNKDRNHDLLKTGLVQEAKSA